MDVKDGVMQIIVGRGMMLLLSTLIRMHLYYHDKNMQMITACLVPGATPHQKTLTAFQTEVNADGKSMADDLVARVITFANEVLKAEKTSPKVTKNFEKAIAALDKLPTNGQVTSHAIRGAIKKVLKLIQTLLNDRAYRPYQPLGIGKGAVGTACKTVKFRAAQVPKCVVAAVVAIVNLVNGGDVDVTDIADVIVEQLSEALALWLKKPEFAGANLRATSPRNAQFDLTLLMRTLVDLVQAMAAAGRVQELSEKARASLV